MVDRIHKSCSAHTKTGRKCTRLATDKGLCSQHYKMKFGRKSPAMKLSPRAFSVAKVMSPTKGCPPGMEKRKGYVRRSFVRSDGTPVQGSKVVKSCILDRGAKGRDWKLRNKTLGIGPLKKGELKIFGYASAKSEVTRHTAIRKAAAAYGALPVERKLNALAVYNSKRRPVLANVFKQDSLYAATLYAKSKKSLKKARGNIPCDDWREQGFDSRGDCLGTQ